MAEIERRSGRFDDGIPEIAPDEAPAVALFLSLATQWTIEPMSGQRLGIDYGKIEPTANMLKIDFSTPLFLDIQTMEREALNVMAGVR